MKILCKVKSIGFTLFKFDLKMKITSFLILLTLFQIHANTYSQNTKITLDLENVSIERVLEEIESVSDFKFFVNTNQVDVKRIVSVKVQKKRISKILKQLFDGHSVDFNVINEQIVLKAGIKKNKIQPKIQPSSPLVILPQKIQIKGVIMDSNNVPLPGASVLEKGTSNGMQTDFDGNFALSIENRSSVLVISYLGFVTQEIVVGSQTNFKVVLEEDSAQLDEVVIVGYGSQKKESVVGAISTVNPSELKIPSSNLTTALAGRVSGVIAYQNSGEPGQDNAQFFVRGVASFNNQNGPLILIDGVELTASDLARLQPDDIETFSVLKDPTTTAIYGARGANGIILVTTKSGVEGVTRINLRYETSISSPVKTVKLADPVTHMILQNEADRTRGLFTTFTEEKIAGTSRGLNPFAYPAIDWFDELFQDNAVSNRVNLNVRGGGKKVRYYVAGAYTTDDGLIKTNKANPFNNNIKNKQYLLRSNINIDLFEKTEMIVRLHSTIDDYTGPLQGGSAVYNAAVRTSPVRFPTYFEPTGALVGVPHILFGNDFGPRGSLSSGDVAAWFNPYAELQRGYRDYRRQLSLVQLEFKQDLSSITPGLTARFLGNANTTSSFENRRAYEPYFYRLQNLDNETGDYTLTRVSDGNESLGFTEGPKTNNSVLYMETAVNYNRTFNEKHNVSGLLVFTAREFLDGGAGNLELSLPSRNLTLAGRYNYDYDNRYFAEFNFGYNGSERFSEKNRWGFFPSFGVGWLVSNESFFNSKVVNRLKFRASYGWVGNDNIGNARNDRFFYLSNVNIDDPSRGYVFGTDLNQGTGGVSISRYANPLVTWETAEKANIGMELNLFNDAIQFRADVFNEERTNILQTRSDIPTTLGLQAPLKTNVGEVKAWGVDTSIDINHYFNDDFWITARGTFVYADNEFTVFEEADFSALGASWRSNIGNNVSVARGFIAERLFVDDEEAKNSPLQFGVPGDHQGGGYGGGDIKYKDLNGDGIISDLDRVPIGKPTIPKITYGFGFSVGYKRWDMSAFFQGLAEVSFFIDPFNTGPFLNSLQGSNLNFQGNGILSENGLLQAYADSHWSEANKDIYAVWPRLSTSVVQNNVQSSTWWLRDGSFLRLKQMEIGFDILKGLEDKLDISRLRLYASGANLVTWSKFKLWDPELRGGGLNYPLQQTFNIGLQVGF